jgi:hypothetical protein
MFFVNANKEHTFYDEDGKPITPKAPTRVGLNGA